MAKNQPNLPKWMMDEIERLQAKQSSGEDFEENDEKHLNELQQLADQEDTDGESSDDDWKQEGRKISEELSRANEQSSEEEVDMIEPLSADDIERVKQEVLRAAMKHILMKVTDDLTGKICQKSIATGTDLFLGQCKGQHTHSTQSLLRNHAVTLLHNDKL